MELPGDWHAVLNMAQSISNVCYVAFIDQFQELLGWKRVNKDVSSCYYQATRFWSFSFLMIWCDSSHTNMLLNIQSLMPKKQRSMKITSPPWQLVLKTIFKIWRSVTVNGSLPVQCFSRSLMTWLNLSMRIGLEIQSQSSWVTKIILPLGKSLKEQVCWNLFWSRGNNVSGLTFFETTGTVSKSSRP